VTRPAPDFLAIFQTLANHKVRYIVVGGVGAVLQGAPVATFDLDLVHSRDSENVRRLIAALRDLDAHYRTDTRARRIPDQSHLSAPGHQLLMTRYGPLDILGAIGSGRGFDELRAHTVELEVSAGLSIQVLDLATLIQIKEEVGGEKDLAALPILKRTLEERRRRSQK
jgi:Aminoglycoside-2''-adenylyltransferase